MRIKRRIGIVRRVLRRQPRENSSEHDSKQTQFADRPAPVAGLFRSPAGVERPDAKADARADAEEAQRASGILWIQPRRERRRRRMEKTSAESRQDDARQSRGI